MSSEEDSLVGYDTSEVNQDRSNSLTSVILQLANAWNIIPESPEKRLRVETKNEFVEENDQNKPRRSKVKHRRSSLDISSTKPKKLETRRTSLISSTRTDSDSSSDNKETKSNKSEGLEEKSKSRTEPDDVELNIQPETEKSRTGLEDTTRNRVDSDQVIQSELKTRSKVGSENKPRSKVGSEDKPRIRVGSEDKPRSRVGSEDKPRSRAGSKDEPRSKVGSEDKPLSRVGSEDKSRSRVGSEDEKMSTDVICENPVDSLESVKEKRNIIEDPSRVSKDEVDSAHLDKVGSQEDGISEVLGTDSEGAKDSEDEKETEESKNCDQKLSSLVSVRLERVDGTSSSQIDDLDTEEENFLGGFLEMVSGPDEEENLPKIDSTKKDIGAEPKEEPEVSNTRETRRGRSMTGLDRDKLKDVKSQDVRQTRSGRDSTPEGRLTRRTAENTPQGRLTKRTASIPVLQSKKNAEASPSRSTRRSESISTNARDESVPDVRSRRSLGDVKQGSSSEPRETRSSQDIQDVKPLRKKELERKKDKNVESSEEDKIETRRTRQTGDSSTKEKPESSKEEKSRRTRENSTEESKPLSNTVSEPRLTRQAKDSGEGREPRRTRERSPCRKDTRSDETNQDMTESSPDTRSRKHDTSSDGRLRRRVRDSSEDEITKDTEEIRVTRSGTELSISSAESPSKNSRSPRHGSGGPASPKKEDGSVVSLLKKKKKKFGEGLKGRLVHESEILKRVQHLKAKGLWVDKKIPKGATEPKTKVHWDFVLEEMTWLSDVVQKEVKIKKANARKCAAMVQKHFKDKELSALRAEKAREANLRKIAASMAREVKVFWGNAQKLFEWRVKQKLEKKRKEALDQHLNYIVDKTEKYSTLLAESLAENVSGQVSRAESVCSGDTEEDIAGDGEYNPESGSSDDEETIDQEETCEPDTKREQELEELEEGAEVPIEELLRKYYPDQFPDSDPKPEIKEEINKDEAESSGSRRRRKPVDFAEVERKIAEEDIKLGVKPVEDIKEEKLEEEKAENEKTTDDKIEKEKDKEGKSVKDTENDDKTNGEKVGEEKEEVKEESDESTDEDEKDPGIKSLVEGEDKLEEYASMAAKFQPTGNTLETTTVKTKIPSLLKHTLREYQHIGLDWLVSLYERSLNGILADEMGLGKTIQTIALLAHLAVDRGNWGPHLIVVPTSVMLNWEMEIKKWCPGFKVMVYFGSQKERKMKRVGWTKPNAFHICITSYKLVIQDHSSFRRFKWQYFILDEAQHIKNFKSQRWQLLLNFASLGRLLLTGTPLQNNLMELWSLMHFLMPHVFESHRDFKEWFSNPLTGMVEGNNEYNDNLIKRLHKVLRPFILRRLKNEVEKQLPKKYEHLVKCPLSKRQRFLYDDFMSRAKTKETLSSGNLLSVINVLMQLRKCCNHPNLFEPRPTLSPFVMQAVSFQFPKLVHHCRDYNVWKDIDLSSTPLLLVHHEMNIDPYTSFRTSSLKCSNRRMLHPPSSNSKLMCPSNKMRFQVKTQNPPVPKQEIEFQSPVLHLQQTGIGYVIQARNLSNKDMWLWQDGHKLKTPSGYFQIAKVPRVEISAASQVDNEKDFPLWSPPRKVQKLETKKPEEAPKETKVEEPEEIMRRKIPRVDNKRTAKGIFSLGVFASEKLTLAAKSPNKAKKRRLEAKAREAELNLPSFISAKDAFIISRRKRNFVLNNRRCEFLPLYGSELVDTIQQMCFIPREALRTGLEQLTCRPKINPYKQVIKCYSSHRLIQTMDSAVARITQIFDRFLINVPKTWTAARRDLSNKDDDPKLKRFPGDFLISRFQVQTPDTRLIQYDCGKLQVLSSLLRTLHTGGHRALIFTQMTKMLDILESFLNYHGYVYMRLDGSTKVEMRQALMERFNNSNKYFIFILSTRSGGVGINLTGADTVIFYDSDWNPTMDAQAQDRCHRIGQTRDVHIYRLISERTVEENILKKANQKRLLGDLAIEGGNFTTAFFKKQTIHDLFEETSSATNEDLEKTEADAPKKSIGVFETALATAEDDTDRQATRVARAEENEVDQDFNEQTEDDQFQAVLSELSKVEVYALHHLEWQEEGWVQEQLDFAQAEIEARKEEFDAEKMDELTQEIREELGDESSEDEEEENDDVDDEEGDETEEEDYAPDGSGSDDEATIEKDEKDGEDENKDNEINMLENDAEVPVEDLIKLYYPEQYKEMDLEVAELPEGLEVGEGGEFVSSQVYAVVAHLDEEQHKNGTDIYDGVDCVADEEADLNHGELHVESAEILNEEENLETEAELDAVAELVAEAEAERVAEAELEAEIEADAELESVAELGAQPEPEAEHEHDAETEPMEVENVAQDASINEGGELLE